MARVGGGSTWTARIGAVAGLALFGYLLWGLIGPKPPKPKALPVAPAIAIKTSPASDAGVDAAAPDDSELVMAGNASAVAVTRDALFVMTVEDARNARGETQHTLTSRSRTDGSERVIATRIPSGGDLMTLGEHVVWTESDGADTRAIRAAPARGGLPRTIAAHQVMGYGLSRAGDSLAFVQNGALQLLGPKLTSKTIVAEPRSLRLDDPEYEKKSRPMSLGLSDALAGNGERLFWSTASNQMPHLYSVALTGGDITIEREAKSGGPVHLLGVADKVVVFADGGRVSALESGITVPVVGDASGNHVVSRSVKGDLYVSQRRLFGPGESRFTLLRLRRGAAKLEVLPYAGEAFDVDDEMLYIATRSGLKRAKR